MFVKKLIILFIISYIISIFIILNIIDSQCDYNLNRNFVYKNDISSSQITVVLIEYEKFDNHLLQTILSFCEIVNVVIISETFIYPPIHLPNNLKCNVDFIIKKADIRKSFWKSKPEYYINTEYVFIIPDSVKLHNHLFTQLIKLQQSHNGPLIVPVNKNINESMPCLDLEVDLKQWTLAKYETQKFNNCDYYKYESGIFLRRENLFKLNSPFHRPFLESFFIQSKIRGLNNKLVNLYLEQESLLLNDSKNEMKRKFYQEERLKKLYYDFDIKKVINSDGEVKWFGCTKTTPRCFGSVINEMPDYLYAQKWTPPCCLENLRKTGRYVFDQLEKAGIRYWLEGGSLLGAARNGDIIPWDYDIDIGIYKDDIKKSEVMTQAFLGHRISDQQEFVWEKAVEGEFIRVHFSLTNRVHVDIFPFYSRNGTMTKDSWFENHKQDCEFPEQFIKSMTKLKFIGWDAYVPKNYVQFLEFKFGVGVIDQPKYPVDNLLDDNHFPPKYSFKKVEY